MIPLIRLCYTLSWSRNQNVVNLVQLGCKGSVWAFFFLHISCYDIMFLNHAELEEVIHIVLAP